MTMAEWMLANLTTQGYSLADVERRRLGLALRFSTGRAWRWWSWRWRLRPRRWSSDSRRSA